MSFNSPSICGTATSAEERAATPAIPAPCLKESRDPAGLPPLSAGSAVLPEAPIPPCPIFVTKTGVPLAEPAPPPIGSSAIFPLFNPLKLLTRLTTFPMPFIAITPPIPAMSALNTALRTAGCFAISLRTEVSARSGPSSPALATAVKAV